MHLDLSTRQLLSDTPDLTSGEDENGYACRVLKWAAGRGYSSIQAVQAEHIKWQSWEVEGLLHRLEAATLLFVRRSFYC